MTIRKSDDEIWFWYCHLENCRAGKISIAKYCKDNNLKESVYNGNSFRIFWIKYTNQELYDKILPISREYLAKGGKPSDLAMELLSGFEPKMPEKTKARKPYLLEQK